MSKKDASRHAGSKRTGKRDALVKSNAGNQRGQKRVMKEYEGGRAMRDKVWLAR